MRNLSLSLVAIIFLATCSEPPALTRPLPKKATSSNVEKDPVDPEETPGSEVPDDTKGDEGNEDPVIDPVTDKPGTDPVVKPNDPVVPDPNTPDPTVPVPVPGNEDLKGHLDISFTMVGPASAGPFRSRGHIRAVWITDSKNAYLRTLDYHASKRAQYLKRYNSFPGSTIDGSSGATDKSLNTSLSAKISWDLKGKDGKIIPSGSYKIWFEMAEANVAGNLVQPADGKQSFDNSAGYAYHIVTVTIDEKAASFMDMKSPVFTGINFTRRLD